ncbi:MAG TPA: DUF5916 domain-containing protein [Holophagaceae bacterium]|nr:DUF5916 domain-containing protein [Holophagaceae bacterium]
MARGWCGLVAAGMALGLSARQDDALLSLRADRTDHPPVLDGRLDDPAWAPAPVASGFRETWPDYGTPARRDTEVRVLYDDHDLYIGARMKHGPGACDVVRRVHRRDQDSPSDWFAVFVDSLHDHRSGYGFWVNAGGVQRDAALYNDTGTDVSWDGVWESAVHVDAEGWTCELKIPLSLLRIRPGEDRQVWGINFSRTDQGRVREGSQWMVPPRGENAFVSRFPELTGLEGLRPRPRRELIPYLSVQDKIATAQAYDDRGARWAAGGDAHLGLGPNAQLDLSARPDFGQVEVDQASLNLSTVESYLPEKRPFFLDGADIFRTNGPTLFYSRRIGAGVPGYSPRAGETILAQPLAQDIDGAAKYTVKTEDGLAFGALAARTGAADATVREADGSLLHPQVAGADTFGVMRATQTLDDRGSFLGGFAGLREPSEAGGTATRLAAADGTWKSEDRSSKLSFALVRSEAGTKDAREDGWYGMASGSRSWASGWRASGSLENAGRSFDVNGLGYLGRADYQSAYASLGRTWDATDGVFRNWGWGAWTNLTRDQAGRVFDRAVGLDAHTDFTTFYSLWGGAALSLPSFDDRELRAYDAPVKKYLRRPARPSLNLGFDTPGNRPWYGRVSLSQRWDEGGTSFGADLFQSLKPHPAMEVQFETSVSHDAGTRAWLETAGDAPSPVPGQAPGTPLTGLRRLAEFNQTLRISYAFSPRLTLQMFSQWLEDAWDYRDLRAYQDDWTLVPAATSDPTAFNDRLWTLNLITRWEFQPGSALFLVYTHGASTDALTSGRAALSPVSDLAALSHLPSDDVLQMKVSWLIR